MLGTFVLLLAGCGPSGKDLVEQHRGELEARVAQIEAFAKRIESGEATQSELALPEGVKLKFKADGKAGNAMELHLAEAKGEKPEMDYIHGGIDLQFVREFLAGQRLDKADSVRRDIENFLQPRFLCIVRDARLSLPSKSFGEETFEPGHLEFEVHCYDLQQKKDLGVVRGKAESSDTVLARTEHVANTDQDLKSSFAMNAGVAVAMAMRPYTD
jgi:hypothetical protein